MRGFLTLLWIRVQTLQFLFDDGGWLKLCLDPTSVAGGGGATEVADISPVNGDGQLGGGGVNGGELPDSSLNGLGDSTGTGQSQGSGVANLGGATGSLQGGTATPAANDWQSLTEAARLQGYQVPAGMTDDRAFLTHLLQQSRVAQQQNFYAQLGQQMAPKAQQIQQYLQTQQQPAAPTQRNPWEPPPFDKRWMSVVEQDPASGLFYAKPGVDPSIPAAVNEYAKWKQTFDDDPQAAMKPYIEAEAKKIATSTFQTQMQEFQKQQAIQGIVNQNQQWLYQRDAGGNVQYGYDGKPLNSPVGTLYLQELQRVSSYGIKDPARQDEMAKDLVRGRIAAYNAQQAAAGQQPVNPQAVGQVNRNQQQALPPSQRARTPGATDPADEGLTLSQQIMRDMRAEGVTDADISSSVGFD